MRIDSHQHFWRYDAKALPWIGEEMEVLRRDYLPPDLAPLLDAAEVDTSVAVQAQHDEGETRWLLELAESSPRIAGVVGWVDLTAPDVEARLDRIAHPHLSGIRHVVQDEPDDRFLQRPDFRAGLGHLADRGLTYDLLVFPRQLPAAIETVAEFPDHAFVLDHIAKPTLREGAVVDPAWERDLRRLATHTNVVCKLSGLVTEADWDQPEWQAEQFAAHVDVVVDAFGAERLLWGSDWPVCLLAGTYSQVHTLALDLLRRSGLEHHAGVLGGNAARVYRLSGASR